MPTLQLKAYSLFMLAFKKKVQTTNSNGTAMINKSALIFHVEINFGEG